MILQFDERWAITVRKLQIGTKLIDNHQGISLNAATSRQLGRITIWTLSLLAFLLLLVVLSATQPVEAQNDTCDPNQQRTRVIDMGGGMLRQERCSNCSVRGSIFSRRLVCYWRLVRHITLTPTPIPTMTTTPIATPTPPAALSPTSTPTPSNDHSLLERPIAAVISLADFETFGTWNRGDEPWGTFTQSAEEIIDGQYAGKFIYDFPPVDTNYVVFRRNITIAGRPDALRLQVYGDGSTHFLNAWVQDANNQLWQFTFGRINHTGWQTMSAPLDLSQGWPNQAIGNPNTTEVVYPIRLYGLVLDGHTSEQAFQGEIYVDALEAVTFADSLNVSTANPNTTSTTDNQTEGGAVAIVTANRLNVRSGPGTGYGIVGKVTRGQSLPVIERDAGSGWVHIKIPGTTGWVSDNYVRIEGAATTASQPALTTPNTTSTDAQAGRQSAPATSATQQSRPAASGPLLGRIAFPAFTDGSYAIYVINADGTNRQRVLGNASQPALSPNGQQLAFRYWKHDQRSIAVMNTYGGDVRRITNFVEDALPAWSPNGQTLVFTSRREGDRRSRIYQASVSGRNDWEIKRDGDTVRSEYAVWMPDGRILYRATRPQISLSIMNNDGDNPISIVPDGDATAPAIAPNGQAILFMSRRDSNWEIYLTDLGGSTLTRLTNHPGNDGLPTWSPDGQSIAFASERSGYWAIWMMNADGSDQRELVAIPGSLDGRVTNEPDYSSRGWTEERISWSR